MGVWGFNVYVVGFVYNSHVKNTRSEGNYAKYYLYYVGIPVMFGHCNIECVCVCVWNKLICAKWLRYDDSDWWVGDLFTCSLVMPTKKKR